MTLETEVPDCRMTGGRDAQHDHVGAAHEIVAETFTATATDRGELWIMFLSRGEGCGLPGECVARHHLGGLWADDLCRGRWQLG